MYFQTPEGMKRKAGILCLRGLLILAIILTFICHAGAQKEKAIFPNTAAEVGAMSGGFDVPFVPTSMEVVRTLLELGSVGPDDFLIDLGSGDGRIVITAAKERGASGFGVDLNKDLVELSKKNAVAVGVEKKVDFFVRDIFETDISRASIVTMYLLNGVNIRLRPKLLSDLKPGSRIISHDFHMGEWRPDNMAHLDIPKSYRDDTFLYLWIVPAKAAGLWQWKLPLSSEDHTFDLELNQSYQNINGVVKNSKQDLQIFDATLKGDSIQFSLFVEVNNRMIRNDYKGRVQGNTIIGTVEVKGVFDKPQLKWQATRLR